MNTVGQREIKTQQRVIRFCKDVLGYTYLGHWKDRPGNGNVENDLLADWLKEHLRNYSDNTGIVIPGNSAQFLEGTR